MKLLFSNGEYGDIFPRMVGLLLLALGIIVVQIIRHHLTVLYSTTLIIRLGLIAGLVLFYSMTSDPFFLILTAVVTIGVLLTGISYSIESKDARPADPHL